MCDPAPWEPYIIGAVEAGQPSSRASIAWALAAIVLWGTLAAAVGDALKGIPAPTLVVLCLAFAAATLAARELVIRRRPIATLFAAPPRIVLLGMWGIFGYHALLFEALERAPIMEANLLNYLWPLLIVLLSPLILRQRLSPGVLIGALVGAAGAALVVTQGTIPRLDPDAWLGYALALTAAISWSTFSLLVKRAGVDGRDRMALFTVWSLLAAIVYALITRRLVVPDARVLAAAAWVGVGTMGIAFICWDRAIAGGNAGTIGVLSYLDPLLSTLCVAWMLDKPITGATWSGVALIIAGAMLAPLLGRATLRTARGPKGKA